MKRVASPPELVAELHGVCAFVQNYPGKPDRHFVAAKLRELADRVALNEDSVAPSDRPLTTLDAKELIEYMDDMWKSSKDPSNVLAMRAYRLKKDMAAIQRKYDRAGGEDMEGYWHPGFDDVSKQMAEVADLATKASEALDRLKDASAYGKRVLKPFLKR